MGTTRSILLRTLAAACLTTAAATLAAGTWIHHRLNACLPRLEERTEVEGLASEVRNDRDMPRVAAPSFSASERLVVEPGHEEEGILEMPGGGSANPLSPYFSEGLRAWVAGKPTPLLPGPMRYRLELVSARAPISSS